LTYDQLQEKLRIEISDRNLLLYVLEMVREFTMVNNEQLDLYKRAINKIDDYFEYRYAYGSQEDNREEVYKIIDNLTDEIGSRIREYYG